MLFPAIGVVVAASLTQGAHKGSVFRADSARFAQWASTIEKPLILSREAWGAKSAIPPFKSQDGKWITVHHAGVATNRNRSFEAMLQALQAFSQRPDKLASGKEKPAWPDIPYHWYIGWRGAIADCRDPKIAGDTNTEYDPTGHLLVCLEGNFESEEPTGEQIRALDGIVTWLVAQYRVDPSLIGTHRDHSKQTSCPGKNLYPEIEKIRERIELRLRCAGVPRAPTP